VTIEDRTPEEDYMIYLGTFSFSFFSDVLKEERNGSFQIVVEDDSPENVLKKFKSIIKRKKKNGELFKEVDEIYLNVFHELKKVPKEGAIINYIDAAGEKDHISLGCFTVDSFRGITGYGWYPEDTEIPSEDAEGEFDLHPFVLFKS
jgi:hypothetical protein